MAVSRLQEGSCVARGRIRSSTRSGLARRSLLRSHQARRFLAAAASRHTQPGERSGQKSTAAGCAQAAARPGAGTRRASAAPQRRRRAARSGLRELESHREHQRGTKPRSPNVGTHKRSLYSWTNELILQAMLVCRSAEFCQNLRI